jgi:bidirectional [NiFe] hydrogenase diaphorase subunit
MVTRNIDLDAQKKQIEELKNRKFQTRKQRSELLVKETKETTAKKSAEKDHPSGDKRFRTIDMVLKKGGNSQDALIEVLHKVQETFGFLDDDVLNYVTRQMKLPLSMVYGVATFYHLFTLKPQGEHNCVVCLGTACYVKGGGQIIEQLEKYLKIKVGETTDDNKLSLLTARCIGACGVAPAITIDGNVSGKQTTESVLLAIKELMDSGAADKIQEKVEALTSSS